MPRGLKVLLVEDNPQVRDFAAELLEDLRCEVTTAEEGAEAIGLLRSQQFDLVFSDVVMPGMGGLELAQQMEAERPDMPVLLATGYSDELLSSDAKNFTVVSKPYDATILGKAISSILQRQRGEAAQSPSLQSRRCSRRFRRAEARGTDMTDEIATAARRGMSRSGIGWRRWARCCSNASAASSTSPKFA